MAGNRLHESCDVEVIPAGLASQQIISDIIKREKEKDPHFEDAFYTIDLNDVSRKMTTWKATVPRVKPFYAVKANNDRYILSTLASLGAGFDCASQAEIASVLDLGVHPSKLVYAHTIKPPNHLRYAKKVGVDLMTFDNKEELLKIKDLHPHARLIVRIKPSGKYKIDFKLRAQFGCTVAEAPALLKTAKDLELNVVGVSFHVGTGIHDGRVFLETISWADQVFGFSKDLGFEFTILDVGGGFFGKKNAPVRFEEVAHHLNQALDTHFPPERGVEIIAEPGRYFATSCTTLTMSVIGKNMITEFPTSAEADSAEGAIQANIGSHWDEPQDRIVSDSTAEGETGNKVLYFVNDGRHGSIGPGYFLISGATEPFVLQDPNFADAFYTTDLSDVSRKMTTWKDTLPRVKPFYAVKANTDKYILSTMASAGAGFDCASQAEIASVLDLGVPPSRIVYAHTVKPPNYLIYARKVGVDLMTFDNKDELLKIKDLHPHARLLLRIKPPDTYKVDFKLSIQFGCTVADAPALLKTAKDLELNVIGVAHHLNQALDTHFPAKRGVEIIAEPGRYFTTSCATLTMSVVGKKQITDATSQIETPDSEKKMFYFVNDGIHGSIGVAYFSTSAVEAPSVLQDVPNPQLYRSAVYGPTCNSADRLFQDCMLPELKIGDWIYLDNMGAYTSVLCSTFNGMPQPKSFYVRSLTQEP